MDKLIIASRNAKKLAELQKILSPKGIATVPVSEYPDLPEIEETGSTFKENSALKAETICRLTGEAVLADDSGLMVDALDGAPGVYSARFSGENATDEKNNLLLLEKLAGLPSAKRTAKFVCVIALALPEKQTRFYCGETMGRIIEELSGDGGFGYDPLFLSDDLGCTFAQASCEQKNRISHRGRALEQFMADLDKIN